MKFEKADMVQLSVIGVKLVIFGNPGKRVKEWGENLGCLVKIGRFLVYLHYG